MVLPFIKPQLYYYFYYYYYYCYYYYYYYSTTTSMYSLSPLSSLPLHFRFFPCLSDPSETVQMRTDKHMAPSLIYRLLQTRQ